MTASYPKSQGSENCVVGGERKKAKKRNTIKWLCIVQGSNTGRKTGLKSNISRYSAASTQRNLSLF